MKGSPIGTDRAIQHDEKAADHIALSLSSPAYTNEGSTQITGLKNLSKCKTQVSNNIVINKKQRRTKKRPDCKQGNRKKSNRKRDYYTMKNFTVQADSVQYKNFHPMNSMPLECFKKFHHTFYHIYI